MKKSSLVSSIIFGIIFLALGIFLFTLSSESTMVLVIAIADLVFSAALFIGGIIGFKGLLKEDAEAKKSSDPFDDIFNSGDSSDDTQTTSSPSGDIPDGSDFLSAPAQDNNTSAFPAPAMSENDALNDQFNDDIVPEPAETDFSSMSPEQIRNEEIRLRAEARRSAQEARNAVDEAKIAMERSAQAEQALAQAEAASRQLVGVKQEQALNDIERLRQQALQCSQAAAAAKQKARFLRDQSKQIALEHSRAVDAAASFMDDDF